MLIRNYGLFWLRTQVNWGKQKNRGSLLGYWRGSKKAGFADFREQKGVYALYDDAFKLVYVGQAGHGHQCLFDRLKQHKFDHLGSRWSRFSWFGTRAVNEDYTLADAEEFHPELKDVLNHIEAILIAVAEPPLNLQRGKLKDVQQYIQPEITQTTPPTD